VIKDNYVIMIATIIIIFSVSTNIILWVPLSGTNSLKWQEMIINPEKTNNEEELKYIINDNMTQYTVLYNITSEKISGNYSRINNTIHFTDRSFTIIQINEKRLKLFCLPTYGLIGNSYKFSAILNIRGPFDYKILHNGDEITGWNTTHISQDLLTFNINFKQKGKNLVTLEVTQKDENYKIEWFIFIS